MVRAKFLCTNKHEGYQGYDNDGTPKPFWTIELVAVYEGAGPDGKNRAIENHIFGEATPSGDLKMTISNKQAADQFVPGKCYYLDMTEAGVPAYAVPVV